MPNIVDDFLNSITMYKTVLYGLILLFVCALVSSMFGTISFGPLALIASIVTLGIVSYLANLLFSALTKAPTNSESYLITALILFFIFSPPKSLGDYLILVLAAVIAMGSKYVLAYKKRHIFNPAAIAAVIVALTGMAGASWWVATPSLFAATLLVGILVIRKIRKFSLLFAFLATSLVEMLIFGLAYHSTLSQTISQALFSWPIIYFGCFMLSEPLTTPSSRKVQVLYGSLIGFLFAFQLPIGPIQLSPELALIAGNIFAFLSSSRQRVMLTLVEKQKLSSTIYNFVFKPDEKLKFTAGQYIEWTLPHKNADVRGNRRFFTIASSPTEENVMLGARISEKGSSFKRALLNMKNGDTLSVGSLMGDFVLPQDSTKKLVFLAGGIGITPFRSIVKFLLDTQSSRDIILFHNCSHGDDFVYDAVFAEAQKRGFLKMNCLLSEKEGVPANFRGHIGHLTTEMIEASVPDYKERMFYISGSNVMVEAYKKLLKDLGVKRSNIITDYFSGY